MAHVKSDTLDRLQAAHLEAERRYTLYQEADEVADIQALSLHWLTGLLAIQAIADTLLREANYGEG